MITKENKKRVGLGFPWTIVSAWIIVIFWMVVIFKFSAQVAKDSNQLSKGVTVVVVQVIEKVTPNRQLNPQTMNHIIRKNAHFSIYLILGVLILHALKRTRIETWRSAKIAFFCCLMYAIVDEMHQILIPGRSGQIKDVLIDMAGASVGIAFSVFIEKMMKRLLRKQ